MCPSTRPLPALLALLLSTLAAPAFASCPGLEGVYEKCGALRGLEPPSFREVSVRREAENQYVFTALSREGKLSSASFLANAQPVVHADKGSTSRIISRCQGEELLVDSDVQIAQFGISLKIQQAVSLTPAGDLMFLLALNGSRPVMVVCKRGH